MRVYLGSTSDDSLGVGTIIQGTDWRYHTNDCFEIWDGTNWTECYDIVRVLPNGEVEWVDTDIK